MSLDDIKQIIFGTKRRTTWALRIPGLLEAIFGQMLSCLSFALSILLVVAICFSQKITFLKPNAAQCRPFSSPDLSTCDSGRSTGHLKNFPVHFGESTEIG